MSKFQKNGLFQVEGEFSARIGSLHKNQPLGIANPSEYCLEDGHIWQGAEYRLDRDNIFGVDIDEALAGETVIVYGTAKKSLDSMVQKRGPCPPDYGARESAQQIRSDWTSPECGFSIGRSTHAKLQELLYIEARAVFALEFIKRTGSDADAGTIEVEVHNPLATPLLDAEIVSHYEGGRGKPQPRYERQKITLQPGERKRVSVVRIIESDGGKGRRFRLHDVGLKGKAGAAVVSATVSAR